MTDLQPAIAGVPEDGPTPGAYLSPAIATAWLATRYGLTAPSQILPGHVLVASMALDREAPFVGIKLTVAQEREWPRTFKYGYPSIISGPSPVLVLSQRPGAFYLNYEAVVPEQVVDWVVLECYRLLAFPLERAIQSESVTGASVHYGPARGDKGWTPSQLDEMQISLLSPFLVMQGHTSPFPGFTGPK